MANKTKVVVVAAIFLLYSVDGLYYISHACDCVKLDSAAASLSSPCLCPFRNGLLFVDC